MKVVFDEIDHFHPNFDESVPNRADQRTAIASRAPLNWVNPSATTSNSLPSTPGTCDKSRSRTIKLVQALFSEAHAKRRGQVAAMRSYHFSFGRESITSPCCCTTSYLPTQPVQKAAVGPPPVLLQETPQAGADSDAAKDTAHVVANMRVHRRLHV